jgi:RNA-binding protein Luc7-like 2
MPIGYGAPSVGPGDEARALLDQLMGLERDVKLDERTNKARHFSDDDVCKYHLCGLSPYTLFRNTKSDLTPAEGYNKTPIEECKAQWDELSQEEKDKHGYEWDLYILLEQFVRDADRKVTRGKARVEAEDRARKERGDDTTDLEEEKGVLIKTMEDLNAKAEAAGEEGDVEVAMDLMEQAKQLGTQVARVDAAISETKKKLDGEKKLILCDVTGNFLSSTDNDERVQAHYAGKQYKGWKAIRDKFGELKAMNSGRGPPRPQRRGEGERDERRQRSRSPDLGRDMEREGRRRSRSPRGERDRDRRDNDRDRGRDRDRDRDRARDRDRDRDRARDRDRGRDRRH